MSYTLSYSLNLGPSRTGLTDLRAQFVDTASVNSGSAITTGFSEVGSGYYQWYYTSHADNFRGGVKFYSNAAPSTLLGFLTLNPQEVENADAKTSTLVSAVSALPSASTIASAVWASGSRTLTSFGTLVADIWAYASRTLTSGAFSAASVWDYLTSSISTTGSIGKLLTDRIDASISSVATTVAAMNPDDVDPGTLVMRTAATYDGEVSGLTSLIYNDWTKALFTMKHASLGSTDAGAILQIQVSNPPSGSNDGLLIINGAEATKNQASLTINAGTGVATIHITDNAMAAIVPDNENNYEYDVKVYDSAGNSRATSPMPVIVNPIVTQTV